MKTIRRQSIHLQPSRSGGGQVLQMVADAWRLEIPAGKAGDYRLAQIDDYSHLSRNGFPWQPPLELSLEARSSSAEGIPGTWGFGLWNDPFSLSLGLGGGTRRFPALPNCAWFFFASPENYLSLRDDLPANGALAATFRSRHWPVPMLAAGSLFLPLLAVPFLRQRLRRVARRIVHQEAASLELDASQWHAYSLAWQPGVVTFILDGKVVLETNIFPYGPLGVVIWIDNQYAALPPAGGISYGTLGNPLPAWIEVRKLSLMGAAA